MKKLPDELLGSALIIAQSQAALNELTAMFRQRCAEQELTPDQIYQIRLAAKIAVDSKGFSTHTKLVSGD